VRAAAHACALALTHAPQVDMMLHFEASAEEAVRGLLRLWVSRAHCALTHLLPCSQEMFDVQITNICLSVQGIIEKMESKGMSVAV
jgi:hypothetical protein